MEITHDTIDTAVREALKSNCKHKVQRVKEAAYRLGYTAMASQLQEHQDCHCFDEPKQLPTNHGVVAGFDGTEYDCCHFTDN